MAEQKTFKWGDKEYLLDDLLKKHAEQEQYFYNFARDKGRYNDEALSGLRQAISNRINAVKEGKAFDADGVLDTDIADNTRIQTQKKGLLRKEKYVDQDNTEWAKHYLNKLVGSLTAHTKKADKKAWDINKYGFAAYLNGQGLSAKDFFEKYDLRDEGNPEAPRSFAQRDAEFDKIIAGYDDWLAGKGFRFDENDNEWDDDHAATVKRLRNNKDRSNRVAFAADLRKIGAGNDYVTAFTSDKWDLSSDTEDGKKAKSEKERKEQIKAYNDAVAGHYSIYEALAPQTAQMTAYMGNAGSNFYMTPDELREWGHNTKGVDINAYQQRYNNNKWDAEAAQYILPIMQANGRLKETTIDGNKYVYDPNSIDRKNHSFIAIDPVTGEMTQRFLYDIEHEAAGLRNKYLKPQGAARYQLETLPFKEGGIISMQTGGNFDAMSYLKQLDDQDYKQRAAAQGIEAKELKEAERTPMGEKTVLNNSEFTGNDLVQLATMATNIGSMFLDPLSGAAVGAGTSVVDFINDINRDGFQGKDAWNLVKNLGMDALGIVPVIGDTFGTLGKVKKGLFQMAPKIIGYLGMAQGVINSPQIIDSFTKILDDRDMTVADWQNVASGINLIVSGTRMGKHAIKDARAKKASLQQDQLQVEVTDKAGNSKLLVLDGDNAKAVRDSDHSVEAVDKIVKNIEGMQDYSVNPKSSLFDYSLRMPGKKVKNETTGAEERSWNPLEAKTQKANVQAVYDPVAYARAYHGQPNSVFKNGYALTDAAIQNKYGTGDTSAVGKQNLEQFKAHHQGRIDSYIKGLRAKAKEYGDRTKNYQKSLDKTKSKITSTKSDIDAKTTEFNKQQGIRDAQNKVASDIATQLAGTGRTDAIRAMAQARADINRLNAEIATLNGKKNYKARKAKREEIKKLQQVITDSQKYLSTNSKGKLKNATLAADQANTAMATLQTETAKLNALLNSLNKHKGSLETRMNTHSSYFDKLINFDNYTRSFNGKDYTFGTKLDKQKLIDEGLFKQGGTIDRNKISKFLNYAKG